MKSIGEVKIADAAAAIAANVKIQPLESTAYLIYEQKAFRYYCEFAAVCVALAKIDSDAAPSPIAVDADGEPWTCARCTYADNRPCFLCCEMCGGERGA